MKSIRFILSVVVFVMLFVAGCTSSPQVNDTVVKEKIIAEPVPVAPKTSPIETHPSEIKEKAPAAVIEEQVAVITDVPAASVQPSIKTFSLVAKQWAFEPGTVTVTKGDTVHLTITSKDVTHGFKIQEYGINEKINPGKKTEIEFVADKAGTFSFFCSVPCGKGHTGMNGQLVVTE